MAWSLIAKDSAGSSDATNVSVTLDTTGADTIFVAVANFGSDPAAPTDSKGNTLTGLSTYTNTARLRWFYCSAAIVGAGHQISFSGTAPSMYFGAYSGGAASSMLDQQNGNVTLGGGNTTIATGSVTPGEDDELLLFAAAGSPNGTVSVDVGSIDESVTFVGGTHFSLDVGSQIQTTATTRNPVFTASTSWNYAAAAILTAKKAAAGGITGPLVGFGHLGGGGPLVGGRLVRDRIRGFA